MTQNFVGFSDHFRGPRRAIGSVCVCLNQATFDTDTWHAGSAWKLKLSRSSLKVKLLFGRGYDTCQSGRWDIELGLLEDINVFAVSVAEWLACWTQARKGLGSNRSRDAVG